MASIFADKDFYPVYHICFTTPRDDLDNIAFDAENPAHYFFDEAILTQSGFLSTVETNASNIQGFYRYKFYPEKPIDDDTQFTPIDEDMCLIGELQSYDLANLENPDIIIETVDSMEALSIDKELMKTMDYIVSGMKYMIIEPNNPTLVFNENLECTRCANNKDLESYQIETSYILQRGKTLEKNLGKDKLLALINNAVDHLEENSKTLPRDFVGIEYF